MSQSNLFPESCASGQPLLGCAPARGRPYVSDQPLLGCAAREGCSPLAIRLCELRCPTESYTLGLADQCCDQLATPPHPKGVGWPIGHTSIFTFPKTLMPFHAVVPQVTSQGQCSQARQINNSTSKRLHNSGKRDESQRRGYPLPDFTTWCTVPLTYVSGQPLFTHYVGHYMCPTSRMSYSYHFSGLNICLNF